jgi:2-methylcitrate dehydratase PrpD
VLRNTYSAHAVLLGMMAAAAAEAGFDMPHGGLEEGRRRILHATSGATPTPAGHWTILDGYLKPFAAVRHTHYGIEAALRLRRHPAFTLAKIGAIKLQVYEEAVRYCGNRAPRTPIQAQFSLSYAIAAALVLGDLGPDAYANLDHPIVTDLERRIAIEADPQRSTRGATLTLDVGGAALSETVDAVAGDPAMPMTKEGAVAKFRRYTDPIVGPSHAAALVAFCLEGNSGLLARQCFALGQ